MIYDLLNSGGINTQRDIVHLYKLVI